MRQDVGEPLRLTRRVVAGQRVLQATQGCPGRPGRRYEGQVHRRLSLRGRGALRKEVVVASGPVVVALVICGGGGERGRQGGVPGEAGVTGREGALAGLGRATPGLSIRRAPVPGRAHGGGPGANAGAAPSLPTGLIQDRECDPVSLPPLISSPASTPLSRPLRFSCRKPEAPPRCRPLPTKRNPACPRPAPGPRTHLRRRRRARWEGARPAPNGPRAAASGADCGRRRGAGRPARSAASSSVPWSVGSGTRPEARTPWGEAPETLPPTFRVCGRSWPLTLPPPGFPAVFALCLVYWGVFE